MKGKLKGTLLAMGKSYLIMSVVGGIFVAVLIGGGYVSDVTAIQVTAKALSNTGGLIVIVFLLGYGLIEFPRSLWRSTNLELELLTTQMDAASEFKAFGEISLKCSSLMSTPSLMTVPS